MADPYLQADGKTLSNKFGIRSDPEALALLEGAVVARRTIEWIDAHAERSSPPSIGMLKAMHGYLFQDAYAWAGQVRTVPLGRLEFEGSSSRQTFVAPREIEPRAHALFERLSGEDALRGLSADHFAKRLAGYYADLNAIHPFREGNGRTQRLFWEELARGAGHALRFDGLSRERLISDAVDGMNGNLRPLEQTFVELLDPQRAQALRRAVAFLKTASSERFDWNDRYIATTVPGQRYAGVYAGAGTPNFLMHDGRRVFVGWLSDLPAHARGLTPGARIDFVAGPAVEPEESRQGAMRPRSVGRER